jgi:hypothetical protein
MQDLIEPSIDVNNTRTRQRSPDEGSTITDSFHWNLSESLGVIVLGILVFMLIGKLIESYERLLRAYAAGYAPRDT